MSRKRQISLNSKAKLSKELQDYKQHKKKKRQGGTGYTEEPITKPLPKKRGNYKYCKKGKGPHDYVLEKETVFLDYPYKTYKCSVCGKKDMVWDYKNMKKKTNKISYEVVFNPALLEEISDIMVGFDLGISALEEMPVKQIWTIETKTPINNAYREGMKEQIENFFESQNHRLISIKEIKDAKKV